MKISIYSEDQKILQQMLKRARTEARLTQQEVASMLGRPQSFVAKYENGERQLNVLELIKVLTALNQRSDAFVQELTRTITNLGKD